MGSVYILFRIVCDGGRLVVVPRHGPIQAARPGVGQHGERHVSGIPPARQQWQQQPPPPLQTVKHTLRIALIEYNCTVCPIPQSLSLTIIMWQRTQHRAFASRVGLKRHQQRAGEREKI